MDLYWGKLNFERSQNTQRRGEVWIDVQVNMDFVRLDIIGYLKLPNKILLTVQIK